MHKKEFAENGSILVEMNLECKNEALQADGIFESGPQWNV